MPLNSFHWIASRLTHVLVWRSAARPIGHPQGRSPSAFPGELLQPSRQLRQGLYPTDLCPSVDRLLTIIQDLSQVGRDLRETIIIDNSPTSYIFHPQHAVPISSWFSDAHDNELLDLIPVLEDLAGSQVRDVSLVLDVSL